MNKTLVIAVVALVVSVGSVMFPRVVTTVVETLGSGSGQSHSFYESFGAGMEDGGDVVATSTVTDSTLKATDLMRAKQIDMTLTQADGTLTLPATSTLIGWIPNPGNERTVYFRNATTTAAVDLTLAVGAGMTFKNSASSSAAVIGDTDGKNAIKATFVRQATGGAITVYLSRFHD